jgi:hypothetical protein
MSLKQSRNETFRVQILYHFVAKRRKEMKKKKLEQSSTHEQ